MPAEQEATGTFLAKADGVLAGLAVATRVCCICCSDLGLQEFSRLLKPSTQVFELVSAKLELSWTAKDGQRVSRGTRFGTVSGPAGPLLTAERVALNFLQRMSGIATATARMQAEAQVSPRQSTRLGVCGWQAACASPAKQMSG